MAFIKSTKERNGDITSTYLFVSQVPNELDIGELFPPLRNEEIASITNVNVKREKYWAWKTLEYALNYAFGYSLDDLKVAKNDTGKWVCDKCHFSISHSNGVVMVGVSKQNIGVDIECLERFIDKFSDNQKFESFVDKIIANGELKPTIPKDLAFTWVKKESSFKLKNKKFFVPNEINTNSEKFSTKILSIQGNEYVISVCGKDINNCKYVVFDGNITIK